MKTTININPSQNSGVAYASKAATEMTVSVNDRTRRAAVTPSTSPATNAIARLATINSNVGGRRCRISRATGISCRKEWPMSSREMFQR